MSETAESELLPEDPDLLPDLDVPADEEAAQNASMEAPRAPKTRNKKPVSPGEQEKIRHVTPNMRDAILDIDYAKSLGIKQPDYASVATRHGVRATSLRTQFYRFKKGILVLKDPPLRESVGTDLKLEYARSSELLLKAQEYLNNTLEGNLKLAKIASAKGDADAYFKFKIDKLMREVKTMAQTRATTEEGFNAGMEHRIAAEKAKREEKAAQARVIEPPVPKHIQRAQDKAQLERALAGDFVDIPSDDPVS